MIVVKIELHSAITHKVTEIGRMYIANVGGTRDRGDYKVAVCRRGSKSPPAGLGDFTGRQAARTGKVENYPRLSYNVWRLISRAVRSAFPEEK